MHNTYSNLSHQECWGLLSKRNVFHAHNNMPQNFSKRNLSMYCFIYHICLLNTALEFIALQNILLWVTKPSSAQTATFLSCHINQTIEWNGIYCSSNVFFMICLFIYKMYLYYSLLPILCAGFYSIVFSGSTNEYDEYMSGIKLVKMLTVRLRK